MSSSSSDLPAIAMFVPVAVATSSDRERHQQASRDGDPDEGKLQARSRPESNLAPYFIDTGKFHATSANLLGFEAYYRPGPWLFGTEYYWEKASSPEAARAP